MFSLPAALNSGQYCATGASRSSRPRSTSNIADAAVAPFVVEKTSCSVSSCHVAAGVLIGDAAPQVDELLAVAVQRERRTDFAALFEVLGEGRADLLEARRDLAADHSWTSSISVPNEPFGCTNATVVPREPGRGALSMPVPPAAMMASSAAPQSATR